VPVWKPAGDEERSWGAGLTKAKMADCRWLKPVLVGQGGVPSASRPLLFSRLAGIFVTRLTGQRGASPDPSQLGTHAPIMTRCRRPRSSPKRGASRFDAAAVRGRNAYGW
jgi:hypothetical protein